MKGFGSLLVLLFCVSEAGALPVESTPSLFDIWKAVKKLTNTVEQLNRWKSVMAANFSATQSDVANLKTSLGASMGSCPSGWQKFGDSCYYRSTDKRSWQESRDHCQSTGADLVIINSNEEQEFIRGFQPGGVWSWIGLKRTEGRWVWVDGTPLTTTSVWRTGYPLDDQERNCVAFHYSTGGLDNWSCSSQSVGDYWICETDVTA